MSRAHSPTDLVFTGKQEVPLLDDGGFCGGAPHVQGQDVGQVQSRRQMMGSNHAGGGPRLDTMDRLLGSQPDGCPAPVGLHHRQGDTHSQVSKPLIEASQVASHDGTDIGVDHRGAGSLILSGLGQQPAGERQAQAGNSLFQDFSNPGLVTRIGVRVKEADRHRANPLIQQHFGRLLHVRFHQRRQDLAPVVHALPDFQPQTAFHQWRRLAIVKIVESRHSETRDLQNVPESLGRDQRRLHPSTLKDGVGGQGKGVADLRETAGRQFQLPQARVERFQHGSTVVVGRAHDLLDVDISPLRKEDDIGEGPPDIHSHPVSGRVGADALLLHPLSRFELASPGEPAGQNSPRPGSEPGSVVGIADLFDGLGLRRIRVDHLGEGPQAQPGDHGQGDLVDHLTGVPGDHGGAENLVGPLRHQDTDHTLFLTIGDRPVHFREFPDEEVVFDSLARSLSGVQAHMGHFRVGVGAPGNGQGAGLLPSMKRAFWMTIRARASAAWVNLYWEQTSPAA